MTADRRRGLLWATLAALYLAALIKPIGGGRGEDRLDAMSPPARQLELAIGERRFDDALGIARELQRAYPRDPLTMYWLGTIYQGLNRPVDAGRAWEAFADMSSEPLDACPSVVVALERLGDAARARVWQQRCAGD